MDNLTSEQRLNGICEILIKGVYLYATKQGWLEDECANKDSVKGMIENDYEQIQLGSKAVSQSFHP